MFVDAALGIPQCDTEVTITMYARDIFKLWTLCKTHKQITLQLLDNSLHDCIHIQDLMIT